MPIRRAIALSKAALRKVRSLSGWTLRVKFLRAFRAGRTFYEAYPHIAKDIAYGGESWRKLDVYWPPDANAERLPVILFVHGGSWSWGATIPSASTTWRAER